MEETCKKSLDLTAVCVRELLDTSVCWGESNAELLQKYQICLNSMGEFQESYLTREVRKIIEVVKVDSINHFVDDAFIEHIFLRIGTFSILIGPFLQRIRSKSELQKSILTRGITHDDAKLLCLFHRNVPIVNLKQVFTGAGLLCRIRGYDIGTLPHHDHTIGINNVTDYSLEENSEQHMYLQAITGRYSSELRMMEAVSRGQFETAVSEFKKMYAEGEHITYNIGKDPYLTHQGSVFVVKTMCRIAALRGGASYYAVDFLSHKISEKTAKLRSIQDINNALVQIVIDYTNLVIATHRHESHSQHVRKAMQFIDSALNLQLTVSLVADYAGVSPNYLNSLFKSEVGTTITKYIFERRMEQATAMLASGSASIQEVAASVGFTDIYYFNRVYKKHYDMSPEEYLRQHRPFIRQ